MATSIEIDYDTKPGVPWLSTVFDQPSLEYIAPGSVLWFQSTTTAGMGFAVHFIQEHEGFIYIGYTGTRQPIPRIDLRIDRRQIEKQRSWKIFESSTENGYDVYCTDSIMRSIEKLSIWIDYHIAKPLWGIPLTVMEIDLTPDRDITLIHHASGEQVKIKLETRDSKILESPDLLVWLDQKMEEGHMWAQEIAEKIQ